MPPKISYTSYDYQPVDIVSVIASFDSSGHIKPLWIRIGHDAYKIASSWQVSKQYTEITEFNCRIIDNGYERPLSVFYHQSECVWTIKKSY